MTELGTDLLNVSVVEEGIVMLRLNRPERRNAVSIALRDDVSNALDSLAQDESVSVVIVTGTGSVFCAGFDLREFENPDVQERLWESSERWHDTLRTFPLPLIASLNGPAIAGGFDLATMCDLRVAADSVYLARPEIEWSPALYSIVRDLIGGALARELSFTNRRIDAAEALSLHLLTRVVPAGQLDSATLDLARQVSRAPRDALMRTKASAIAASRAATGGQLIW